MEFLIKMERFEDALSYGQRLENRNYREMSIYAALKQHEKANEIIQSYISKGSPLLFPTIIQCYIWMDEYEMARNYMDSELLSRELNFDSPQELAYRALILNKTGNQSAAQDLVKKMKTMSDASSAGMAEYNLGRYYSGIGEIDTALFWLEKAFDERCVDMSWLKADPVLKNLGNIERYQDLLKRTGHKAYDKYMAEKNRRDN
jgi:tetratricopeptide (TPR) repeat protein